MLLERKICEGSKISWFTCFQSTDGRLNCNWCRFRPIVAYTQERRRVGQDTSYIAYSMRASLDHNKGTHYFISHTSTFKVSIRWSSPFIASGILSMVSTFWKSMTNIKWIHFPWCLDQKQWNAFSFSFQENVKAAPKSRKCTIPFSATPGFAAWKIIRNLASTL